jgi:hypothetical protein
MSQESEVGEVRMGATKHEIRALSECFSGSISSRPEGESGKAMASTQPELIRTLVPADRPARYENPPKYLNEALEDAERLLKYASEFGVSIEDELRDHILHARAVGVVNWTEEVAANVLASLSKLAARLKPITAESLKA